tara:strand:+ start:83 stop:226 length:144 start_codon:yes stop_codon:yes gene_type:complete
MPTKKPQTEKTDTAKAVVSELGVNEENPVPEKKGDVKTKNGNTITYN